MSHRPRSSASISPAALARAGIALPTPASKATRPRRDLEHRDQSALMDWATNNASRLPGLGLLFAIPNGGHRNVIVAKRLKAEGVKPGVPDLCLPVARGQFHGLFLELKADRNTATLEQTHWIEALRAQGYAAFVTRGWESAAQHLEDYLTGRISREP